MRSVCTIVLCACGFQNRLAQNQLDDASAETEGALTDDAMIDAPDTTAPVECPQSTDLVACWAFEDNGDDGSGNNHTATVAGASYVTGKYGFAIDRTAGSDVQVASDAAFNLNRFTFELWVRADSAPPSSDRIVLFDKGGQYGIVWQDDLDVECIVVHQGGQVSTRASGGNLPSGAWTHVACNYDGANVRVFVDGVQVAIEPNTANVDTTGSVLRLGEDEPSGADTLDGRIDTVRLWRVAQPSQP